MAVTVATLVLLLAVLVVALSGYVAWQLTHPSRDHATQTPTTVGLVYSNVTFKSREGKVLLAGWFMPARQSTRTVIMVPGYAQHRMYEVPSMPLAQTLVRAGFNVLAFDPRDTGDSGGQMVTLGVKEQYDVLGAVDYVKQRFTGQHPRIGILAYSANSGSSLLAAGKDPSDVQAVVVDSAIAQLYPYIVEHADIWTHLPSVPFNQVIAWTIPILTGMDPHVVDGVAAVRQLPHMPIFFIAGTSDNIVPYANTVTLYHAATTQQKQLWLIPGGGHTDSYKQQPQTYLQRVEGFFSRYLNN